MLKGKTSVLATIPSRALDGGGHGAHRGWRSGMEEMENLWECRDGTGNLTQCPYSEMWEVCCWTLLPEVFLGTQEEKAWLCKSHLPTTQTHTATLAVDRGTSLMIRACQYETRPQLCYQRSLPHNEYLVSTARRVIL